MIYWVTQSYGTSARYYYEAAHNPWTPVHDRMPVVLAPDAWDEWLDPANRDVGDLQALLVSAPEDLLALRPVSTLVNDVRNKGEECLAAG